MDYLFSDAKFWVAVSFLLFMGLFIRLAAPKLIGMLDQSSAKIRNDLAEAERLRQEAAALLADYQQKEQDALREAEELLKHAKESAEALRISAEKEMQATLARKLAQAEANITRAEEQALQTIRDNMVDIAIEAARMAIVDHLRATTDDPALQSALKDIGRVVH
jgi:F-type H+-transporting ATPase subunit b